MSLLNEIPVFEGGVSRLRQNCGNGYEMLYLAGTSANAFRDYCKTLERNGYCEIAVNEKSGNCFRTFLCEQNDLFLYLCFYAHSGETRVIVARAPDLYTPEPIGDPVCEPILYPLPADGGMGYVFRASDGSFLIVDGGYRNESDDETVNGRCAKNLYRVLKELSPDPEHISVSCWILTHAHKDHVGTFTMFAELYGNDPTITINGIMHNMCLTEEQSRYLDNSWAEMVLNAIAEHYPGVPVYIALTGQIYRFCDLDVEILYTMPDYMPKRIEQGEDATSEAQKKGDGNIQSVVFRVTVNGHGILMMADTTAECCDEMCARYGSYLQSEYVQMAHHGIGYDSPRAHNATEEIYTLIAPTYALLPCSGGQVDMKLAYEVNQYLLKLIGGKENVICSGTYKKSILLLSAK